MGTMVMSNRLWKRRRKRRRIRRHHFPDSQTVSSCSQALSQISSPASQPSSFLPASQNPPPSRRTSSAARYHSAKSGPNHLIDRAQYTLERMPISYKPDIMCPFAADHPNLKIMVFGIVFGTFRLVQGRRHYRGTQTPWTQTKFAILADCRSRRMAGSFER